MGTLHERCEQAGHGISWEGVALLVKAVHHNGDTKIMQREIYLEYDLKYKKESMLINHTNFVFANILMYTLIFFPVWHKHALNHKYWIIM